MSDKVYIYGDSNGSTYDGATSDSPRKTFWDARVEVAGIAHTVQLGVVPASEKSTDEQGLWDPSDGQFLNLSRDGINRLIRALREARDAMYGRDE